MARLTKLLAAGLLLLLLVALVRAARLGSRQVPRQRRLALAAQPDAPTIDAVAAARRLAEAVRIPTVSAAPLAAEDLARFEALHACFARNYPLTWSSLERELVNGASLLLYWPGRDLALDPILVMAHLDVVPVEPESADAWRHPPFEGVLAEGCVWGRGSLDDKGAACAWLEAVEAMLAAGEVPARSVYLAFGHDEELGGAQGNAEIARRLAERGRHLAFVLDEGGYLTQGLVSLVDGPLALVGVAEKGYLTVELQASSEGGHSSVPVHPTAIDSLARALATIEAQPAAARIDGATRAMLDWLAPEVGPWRRALLANLWLSEGPVVSTLAASPRSAALVRTTQAPTMIAGGVRENVLPTRASAQLNLRLLPGDTIESTLARLGQLVDDPSLELRALPGACEASAVSSARTPAFELIQRAIAAIDPEALVAPYLVVGGTDSRHYAGIAEQIYRFRPYRLTPESVARFHGPNEQVSIEQHADAIRFCLRLLRSLDESGSR